MWLYFKIGYNTLLSSIYASILVLLFSCTALVSTIFSKFVSKIVLHIDVEDQPQWYINFIDRADDAINSLAEK